MTETTAPAATSTSGSAITAADFSSRTTDSDRHRWTPGKMIHLVKALGDTPVAIVLDTYTGNTQVNVRLSGVRQTPGYGSFQVLVTRVDGDDVERGCWHPLDKVGTVIVLGRSNARWDALRSYADERIAAILNARPKLAALYPETENVESGCTWRVTRFPHRVEVSFDPDRTRFPFSSGVKHHYWTIPLTRLG
jgi:hypothetical protein